MVNSQNSIESQALSILQTYWRHDKFREKQLEIIVQIIRKIDAVVLFPTGGGKSITFQIPALIFPHVTLVITPLIALMDDQVNSLKSKGIQADAIHSGIPSREITRIIENAKWGNTKLLYISPERLNNERFIERLKTIKISLIAIDEAHCISQWGHDFRPSYLKIGELSDYWQDVTKIAVTATATPKIVDDIIKFGGLRQPKFFKKSFRRKNISLHVHHTQRKYEKLKELMKRWVEINAIVYIRSRREVQNLAQILAAEGYTTGFYHAGLTFQERQKIQGQFMKSELQVICATNAFGMGLDKSDVRQVIHFDVPPSLEEYVQEFGRAGRDGKASEAHILVNDGNKAYAVKKNREKFPSFDFIKTVYVAIFNHFQIPIESGEGIVKPFDIIDFCNKIGLPVAQTFHALQILNKNEYIDTFEQNNSRSTIKIIRSAKEIRENKLSKSHQLVLSSLVRLYEGILDQTIEINLKQISIFCDMKTIEVKETLSYLNAHKWIDYQIQEQGKRIFFLKSRLPKSHFHINKKLQKSISENSLSRLQSMLSYLETEECRSTYITSYFGESDNALCRICDNCDPIQDIDDSASFQNRMEEGL